MCVGEGCGTDTVSAAYCDDCREEIRDEDDEEEVEFGGPRDWLKATVYSWSMYAMGWATAWLVVRGIEQRETTGGSEWMEAVPGITVSTVMPDAAIGAGALVAILYLVLGGIFGTVATIGLLCSSGMHGAERLAAYWRGGNDV